MAADKSSRSFRNKNTISVDYGMNIWGRRGLEKTLPGLMNHSSCSISEIDGLWFRGEGKCHGVSIAGNSVDMFVFMAHIWLLH